MAKHQEWGMKEGKAEKEKTNKQEVLNYWTGHSFKGKAQAVI